MRIFLHIVLPLVTPVAIYALWAHFDSKRQGLGMPGWEKGHWFWVILFGAALAVASVVWYGVRGNPEGEVYVPPHVEDGRVVPGQFRERK